MSPLKTIISCWFFLVVLPVTCFGRAQVNDNQIQRWDVSVDNGKSWQPIEVPSTIENRVDVKFDGISKYRTELSTEIPAGKRVIVRFEGVATEATVFLGGEKIGSHLGAWTPFEIDLTEQLQTAAAQARPALALEVICDEKVGHNTQGFLPIIAPHFGGIWKPVHLQYRNDISFVADQAHVRPDLASGQIHLELPITNSPGNALPAGGLQLAIRVRKQKQGWSAWRVEPIDDESNENGKILAIVAMDLKGFAGLEGRGVAPQAWSPSAPVLYDVDIKLLPNGSSPEDNGFDRIQRTSGFRDIRIEGERLLLNGKPLVVRGLLNWGYAPPSVAPTLDEAEMRKEIEFAIARGFNLMKFCLWVPPKRYLELCDEYGMLAWVEYPTWHPDFSPRRLEALEREYIEFFQYDRNHPSVILRSLTCETGPSASLQVIKRLYDLCKQTIPNAIVEDDSSWIQWNRVHDFYDDHPYGNNHTWPSTLTRLKIYMDEHGKKPLVLGEAIAADTWVAPQSFPGSEFLGSKGRLLLNGKIVPSANIQFEIDSSSGNSSGKITATTDSAGQYEVEAPFHYPIFLASNRDWFQSMTRLDADLKDFQARSRQYAMAMRKYQIEKYRELVPTGGYVVSVIRDFRKAGMGLIDFHGVPKSTPDDWRFQSEHSISMATDHPRLAFPAGPVSIPIRQSRAAGDSAVKTNIDAAILFRGQEFRCDAVATVVVPNHGVSEISELKFELPNVAEPTSAKLMVNVLESKSGKRLATSEWRIWVVPNAQLGPQVELDATPELLEKIGVRWPDANANEDATVIQLVDQLDHELLRRINEGAKVILVPSETGNTEGQFRLSVQDHWFLRGGPVVFRHDDWNLPTEMVMALQHFDLAGPVIQNIQTEFDSVHPLVGLWDNHDISETKTHGLVVSMPVGKGQLLLSTLNHWGLKNIAGRWMLAKLANGLARQPTVATERSRSNFKRLLAEVNQNVTEVHERNWQFRPDQEFAGIEEGWHLPMFDDSGWGTITCRGHWEGQGHSELDGWAWYRIKIDDKEWIQRAADQKAYLNFQGVDDHYRVWVNGKFVGQDGVIETKETAFDSRKSFEITQFMEAGKPVQIAIAVYDWYGAGGIFRPVSLSNSPLSTRKAWFIK